MKRGEVIGQTGTTGASTGVHLHFETRRSRQWGTDFNPESILSQEYANEPSQPVLEPPRRVRVRMPQYGISGVLRAQDQQAVNMFMAGRR